MRTAQELMAMATQGDTGIAQAMLPFMPEGLTAPVLRGTIKHATDGPCVAFQPETLISSDS